MADFSIYKPIVGTKDYIDKYTDFVNAMEAYANEEEAAREGETTILANLTNNYLNYTLETNVNGASNTYKCTNMANGTGDQDYITVSQANSWTAGTFADISDVGVGSLNANDILVINTDGTAITGRPTSYTILTNGSTVIPNGNYDMDLAGVSKTITLPDIEAIASADRNGIIVSFADIGGNLDVSHTLTIQPNSTTTTQKIMGITSDSGNLIIDDYPFCSFDLVYTSTSDTDSFGWTLARFQR